MNKILYFTSLVEVISIMEELDSCETFWNFLMMHSDLPKFGLQFSFLIQAPAASAQAHIYIMHTCIYTHTITHYYSLLSPSFNPLILPSHPSSSPLTWHTKGFTLPQCLNLALPSSSFTHGTSSSWPPHNSDIGWLSVHIAKMDPSFHVKCIFECSGCHVPLGPLSRALT
jgi:hypothetical protein